MNFFKKHSRQPPTRVHLDPMAARQYYMAVCFLDYIRCTDDNVRLSWIDFFLDCVRRDLQADIEHNPFSALSGNFDTTPFPLQYFDNEENPLFTYKQIRFEQQEAKNLLLLEIPIETQWLEKLADKYQQTMPQIFVYEPLQIAIVLDKKTPKAEWLNAAVIDLSALFPHVKTNGYHWKNAHSGTTLDGQIPDFRIAVLYAGIQHRTAIRKRLDNPENSEEKM